MATNSWAETDDLSLAHEEEELDYNEDVVQSAPTPGSTSAPAGEEGEIEEVEDGELKDDDDSDEQQTPHDTVKTVFDNRQELSPNHPHSRRPISPPTGPRFGNAPNHLPLPPPDMPPMERGAPPPYDQQDYYSRGPPRPPRLDPSLTICKFFIRGMCNRGESCAFLHQMPSRPPAGHPPPYAQHSPPPVDQQRMSDSGRDGWGAAIRDKMHQRQSSGGEPVISEHSDLPDDRRRRTKRRAPSTSSDSSDDRPPARRHSQLEPPSRGHTDIVRTSRPLPPRPEVRNHDHPPPKIFRGAPMPPVPVAGRVRSPVRADRDSASHRRSPVRRLSRRSGGGSSRSRSPVRDSGIRTHSSVDEFGRILRDRSPERLHRDHKLQQSPSHKGTKVKQRSGASSASSSSHFSHKSAELRRRYEERRQRRNGATSSTSPEATKAISSSSENERAAVRGPRTPPGVPARAISSSSPEPVERGNGAVQNDGWLTVHDPIYRTDQTATREELISQLHQIEQLIQKHSAKKGRRAAAKRQTADDGKHQNGIEGEV